MTLEEILASEKELEAIFYQADTELKGEISRQELVEPLVLKSGTDWGQRPLATAWRL